MNIHHLFNPGRVIRGVTTILPWCSVLAVICGVIGLYYALITSPADYQQGETVRIMYVHVPTAWMAMMLYVIMASTAAAGFVWRNPFSFMLTRAIAPVGLIYTVICLITGSLWGKPMWGAWWVWDARLTSMLILAFFYMGYLVLVNSFDDRRRAEKMAGLLTLVGVVNIPIIKFSVDWWSTLHQPASILRSGGVAIDGTMLVPLIWMAGFSFLFACIIIILRLKTLWMLEKLDKNPLLV